MTTVRVNLNASQYIAEARKVAAINAQAAASFARVDSIVRLATIKGIG